MRIFVLIAALLFTVSTAARKPFGTLTVVQSEPVAGGPSPLSALTESDWRFVELVYAPLYSKTSKGYLPWLGSTVTKDASGRILTVSIADSAQWSTGRDVSPKDIVYTYQLAREGKWNRAYVVQLDAIRDVRIAKNNLDVEFELKHSIEVPESLLTVPLIPNGLHGPLDDPSRQRPLPLGVLGAGPYKLKAKQNTADLVFNETCMRRPHISEVRFITSGDPAISVDMVRLNGDTVTFDHSPIDNSIASREFAAGFLQLPLRRVVMIAVGSSKSGWTDPIIARVVRMIINRQELFTPTENGKASDTAPAPASSETSTATNTHSPDVNAAQQLLEDNGWTRTSATATYIRTGPSGESEQLEIPLLIDADDNAMLRRGFVLRQRFAQAGIRLRLDARPRLELLSRLASREFSAALVSLQGDLNSLFHSKGAWNFSGFSDETTDAALKAKRWSVAAERIRKLAPSVILGTTGRTGTSGRNVMVPKLSGAGGFGEFYKWRIR